MSNAAARSSTDAAVFRQQSVVMCVVPLSSCHRGSEVWLWTERMAGMCVMCSRVWLQKRGPSVEGRDASADPED